MTTVFRDWKLQLQWDDSKIAQGLKRLDKLMSRTLETRYKRTERVQKGILERDLKYKSQESKNARKAYKQQMKEHVEALRMNKAIDRERSKSLNQYNKDWDAAHKEEQRREAAKERQAKKELKRLLRVEAMNKALDKNKSKADANGLEAQKKYISNLDAIDRKLRRQQFAVSGRPGSSSVTSSINQQRQAVAAMKQSALDMGGNFKNTAMYSDQLKRLRENAALAGKQVHSLTKQLSIQEQATHSLGNSIRNLGRSYVSVFAAIAGYRGMSGIGQGIEQAKSSLIMLSGTQEGVAKDWEYVSQTAIKLGTDLTQTTKGYQSIMYAAKNMNMTQEEAKNVFMASQESARAFNLSIDDSSGVTRAFSQMMSKGVVSLEELNGQLGDRMPAVMNIAAKSMNMTSAELYKLISTGKVTNEEFIIPFSNGLRGAVRETGALEASLKTVTAKKGSVKAMFDLNVSEWFEGASDGMKTFWNTLFDFLQENTQGFRTIGEATGVFFKTLSYGIKFITPVFRLVTDSLKAVMTEFKDALSLEKSSEEISWFATVVRRIAAAFLYVVGSVMWLWENLSAFFKEQLGPDGIKGFLIAIGLLISGWFLKKIMGVFGYVFDSIKKIKDLVKGVGQLPTEVLGDGTDVPDKESKATKKGGKWKEYLTAAAPFLKFLAKSGALFALTPSSTVSQEDEMADMYANIERQDQMRARAMQSSPFSGGGVINPSGFIPGVSALPPPVTNIFIDTIAPNIYTNNPEVMNNAIRDNLRDMLQVNP